MRSALAAALVALTPTVATADDDVPPGMVLVTPDGEVAAPPRPEEPREHYRHFFALAAGPVVRALYDRAFGGGGGGVVVGAQSDRTSLAGTLHVSAFDTRPSLPFIHVQAGFLGETRRGRLRFGGGPVFGMLIVVRHTRAPTLLATAGGAVALTVDLTRDRPVTPTLTVRAGFDWPFIDGVMFGATVLVGFRL